MADDGPGAAEGLPSVNQLLDKIGVGFAQARTILLATGAVDFCDGAELALVNIVVMATAKEFELNDTEKALVTAVTLAALALGVGISGYFGDHFGRRGPTLACLGLTALLGCVCASMPTYVSLLIARGFLGVSMGFGMSPSTAMLSETTPERKRLMVRAPAKCFFQGGSLYVALLAAVDDPDLLHVEWRWLMVAAAVPAALAFLLAIPFLPESPVFLASVGMDVAAKAGFKSMAWLNGKGHMSVDYEPPDREERLHVPSCREQLGTVLSKKYLLTTLIATYAAFCINLAQYGDAYAAPQVLSETRGLDAAWKLCIKFAVTMVAALLWGFASLLFAHKTLIVACFALIAAALVSFALCAGHKEYESSMLTDCILSFGTYGTSVGAVGGFIVIYQLAAEVYPTTASSTGGAVVGGGGRVAAVLAPLMYEVFQAWTGHWSPFYYTMAAMSALAAVLVCCMDEVVPYRFEGCSKILPKRDLGTYGTTAK